MPIYEYVCDRCQDDFEKLVFGDDQVNCPNCQSDRVSRKVSRFGLGKRENGANESLPLYKSGGCGCNPSGCGCKN